MSGSTPPNQTLYINNLNDKIKKEELRAQLFALFMTYGRVIDVVAQKGRKMKGQAFLVFADLAEATAAMRACEGMIFYDKPMHIHYAKTRSFAVLRREDPEFVPPNPVDAGSRNQNGALGAGVEKRGREEDEDMAEGTRQSKRERVAGDEDGEEMDMEEDEEVSDKKQAPDTVEHPSPRLLCTNLPQEVTDDMLGVLFQQYRGFISAHTAASPTPTPAGQPCKMAQVIFESANLATVAKEALDGFTIKRGWKMTIAYM